MAKKAKKKALTGRLALGRTDEFGNLPPEGVSPEEILQKRSMAGGWTRATLAEWGVAWPPKAGWRQELEGRWKAHNFIEDAQSEDALISYANMHDPIAPTREQRLCRAVHELQTLSSLYGDIPELRSVFETANQEIERISPL